MSGRTSYSDYLLHAAEAALSPVQCDKMCEELFTIAPNPFDAGRKYQRKVWTNLWCKDASRLIWC